METARTVHQNIGCKEAKRAGLEKKCIFTDMRLLYREISKYRMGGFKLCSAGFLEWFVPIWEENRLKAILFAGVRKAPTNFQPKIPLLNLSDNHEICAFPGSILQPEEEELIFEGLHQLAARIQLAFSPLSEKFLASGAVPRAILIRHLICTNYRTPEKIPAIISQALFLSESRTLHVIREETGHSLKEMIHATQMNHAGFLLKSSVLPIKSIAMDCGFENFSNFFRLFKKHFHCTPLHYRKTFSSES